MKSALTTLLIWLALVIPCAASTYNANMTSQPAGSGNANNAVPVPPGTVNGDTLLFCFMLNSQTVTTLGGTFTSCTNFASVLDVTNGGLDMKCGCRVASSEPASYTPTWTGNSTSNGIMIDLKSTDNTTPLIDVTPVLTGGGAAPSQVTTSTNNDLIDVVILDNTAGTGAITGTQYPLGIAMNEANMHVLNASQKTAGATTWLPTSITFSGAGTVLAMTIAIKSNTTSAESFVGLGTDSFNSGSASSVSPGLPSNANTGDTLIAGIQEDTNTGIAITAPVVPDVQVRGHSQCTGTATCNVTSPASMKSTDIEVAYVWSGLNHTPGAPAGWTQIRNINSVVDYSCFKHTSPTAGAHTVTFTSTSGVMLADYAVFYSGTGGTMAVDDCQLLTSGSTGSWPAPSVTTTGANRVIFSHWLNNTTCTMATGVNTLDIQGGDCDGWYFQAASGASATPAVTWSGGNQAYGAGQTAISSGGAAGPTWNLIKSQVNEAATVQLNTYSLVEPSTDVITGPLTWAYASNPALSDGIITAWSNLNITTPVDINNAISNEGLQRAQQAPLIQPTPNDEFAVTYNGYTGCAPSGKVAGQYPQQIWSPTSNGRISIYYATMNGAMAAQPVDQCGGPYDSISHGLNAATAPTTTNANLRIQQQIEEIFALAPAPVPPTNTGSWFF